MPSPQIWSEKDRVGEAHERVKHERQHDHRKKIGQNVNYSGGDSHSGAKG